MKKMKRVLVAMLGCLTAFACLAGVVACKKENDAPVQDEVAQVPSYDININMPSNDVEKCVHDYSVVYADKAATCEDEGYNLIGCSKCGERLTDSFMSVPALGHKYAEVEEKLPTHTEEGYTAHDVCETCGDKVGYVVVPAIGHTYAPATCKAPATCDCGATDGVALPHKMVYVFDEKSEYNYDGLTNVVDGWIDETIYATELATLMNADNNGLKNTCTTNGMKQFKICHECAAAVILSTNNYEQQDEKLAWGDKTPLERFEYIVANSYTEGFEAIPASHTMVDYFDTTVATANAAGEYVAATCTTKGLKNFKVCKVCAPATANWAATSYEAIRDMLTVDADEPATEAVVYAEGFEVATTVALGHNYVDPATGINSYKAGLDQTCAADGFTESYHCYNCGLDKQSTTLYRDAHDGEVNGVYDATKVENANSKIAKCGKANYCGDCKTYWGSVIPCAQVSVTKTATCLEAGYTGTVCPDCGVVTYSTYAPATGHKFGTNPQNAKANVPATCTTAEVLAHFVCDNGCGAKAFGTEVKDASGTVIKVNYQITTNVTGTPRTDHKIVKVDGTTETLVASNGAAFCNILVNEYRDYVNKTNAQILAAGGVANASCVNAALSTYKCSNNCGFTYGVSLHNYNTDGAWYVDALGYPSASAASYTYNNTIITAIEYASLSSAEQAKAVVRVFNVAGTTIATCTAGGACGICKQEVKAATGHSFNYTKSAENKSYFPVKYATCTMNGTYEYFACTNPNCQVVSYDVYGNGGTYSSIAKDANGNDVELTKSNVSSYLAIKAHGHDLVAVAALAPTCTTVGYKAHEACKVCGFKSGYQEIAKVAHGSSAMGSCAAEVICDKAYFVDTNNNGQWDNGEVWYGCGATINNTNHQPDNHHWENGECDCCKLECAHPAYTADNQCTVCGKNK